MFAHSTSRIAANLATDTHEVVPAAHQEPTPVAQDAFISQDATFVLL
ncbi:MAG: hypothetical protein R2795_08315 [Saprospiraceae bacterium]